MPDDEPSAGSVADESWADSELQLRILYNPSSRGNVILVVDDEPELCHLVAESLQKADYVVLTATSYREALATLATHAVDLVLLDVMMPDLDGIATLSVIREQSTVPVIIFSAVSRATLSANYRLLERAAYLPKPSRYQHLLDTIQWVLHRHRLARQRRNSYA